MLSDVLAGLTIEVGTKKIGCAVIDEGAVTRGAASWNEIAALSIPVVLLADTMSPSPLTFAGTVLRKPLLGGRLIEAVAKALGQSVPSR